MLLFKKSQLTCGDKKDKYFWGKFKGTKFLVVEILFLFILSLMLQVVHGRPAPSLIRQKVAGVCVCSVYALLRRPCVCVPMSLPCYVYVERRRVNTGVKLRAASLARPKSIDPKLEEEEEEEQEKTAAAVVYG